jgi:hypothetical protein
MNTPNKVSSSKKVLTIKPIQIKTIKIMPIETKIETLPIDILSKLKIATEHSKEAIVTSNKEISNKTIVSSKKKIIKKVVHKKPLALKKKRIPKRVVSKKVVVKRKVIKKNFEHKIVTNVVVKKVAVQQTSERLSREEEVAFYQKKYANNLELVNISENFEINEENSLPDSYYFEPLKKVSIKNTNAPLEFVEKLGVVETSTAYEVNFMIPD